MLAFWRNPSNLRTSSDNHASCNTFAFVHSGLTDKLEYAVADAAVLSPSDWVALYLACNI